MIRALGATLLLFLVGCPTEESVIDPFPVPVDLTAGPVLVTVEVDSPDESFVAPIDTLSPLTIVDSFAPGDALQEPSRRRVALTFLGEADADAGVPSVPRARFTGTSVFDFHPCAIPVEDPENPPAQVACTVGTGDDPRTIGGVIGADLLSRGAVRFDFPDSALQFFSDIAGSDRERGRACDAVIKNAFSGGGTLRIAGAEISFTGRRIALGACLAFDTEAEDELARGTDALLVVSTGIGPTLLAQSAYERYRRMVPTAPEVNNLPQVTVYLPSGPIQARLGTIERLALVGEQGSERARGPCEELFASHVMSEGGCTEVGITREDCPCDGNRLFCQSAGAVELAEDREQTIEVAIVSDAEPLLQSLREELRPDLPEVDGVLGTAALAPAVMDVDYPSGRVLFRCSEPGVCQARPAVVNRSSTDDVAACPNLP